MSIIEFIILAIALSLETLIVMHGCALNTPIRLTKGVAESLTVALVNTLLLIVGILLGNLLRFTPADISPEATSTNNLLNDSDNLVYLGLMILVAVRLLFRSSKKRRTVQPYDISRFSTALLLGVAIGVNTLFVGLALGFRIPLAENIWRSTVPLFIFMTLFGLLGIMLGRQKRELRAQRYTLFAVLILLAFALKIALWG
ncbi:MAG: manganese efflux pump [Bacteroidales bacterium]|nr:manganese efflux pump [Bacteroidales bacterium]